MATIPPHDRDRGDLENFNRRLRQHRSKAAPESGLAQRLKAPPGSLPGLAFRVSVELVSAFAVGAGMGWLLDVWMDTRPFMMVAFIVLGSIAGVLNVYRVASGYGYAAGYREPSDSGSPGDSDRDEG